jgi:hypothetical protein
MGLYMAMAMQLLSRPQDRLFHVLLDPRLGEPPPRDFFYPSREFVTGDSHIPTADIRIDCDEIPLLSWPSQVRPSGAVHFRDLLAQQQLCLQSLQEPPNLVIDGKKKQIFIGEFLALKLEPKELYYYSLVASLAACKPARRLPARELGQWFHEVTQEWARDKNSLGSAGYIPKPFIQNLSETQGQDSAFSLYREMFRHYAATRCESPSDARPAKFQREFRSDFELDAKENPTVLQTFSRINNKLKKVIKDPRLLDLYVIRKGKHTRGEPEEKSTYGIWLNSSLIQVSI